MLYSDSQILQKIIPLMQAAAVKAGKYQLTKFNQKIKINTKSSSQDLVTEADIFSQKIIHKTLQNGLNLFGFKASDFGFLGEENLLNIKEYTFVIDPIDGTSNFVSGFPFFTTIIALLKGKTVIAGLVSDPTHQNIYWSLKGHGVFKKSWKSSFESSLKIQAKPKQLSIVSGASGLVKQLPQDFLKQILGSRILHGTGIETWMMLENLIHFNLARHTKIWDISAPSLFLSEIGGTVTDFKGEQIELDLSNPNKKYPHIACITPEHFEFIQPFLKYLKI